MSATPYLQMRAISKSYEGTRALRGVDLAAARGEVHAIVGENGAGKSTLTKILTGAVQPDAGQITLDGALHSIDSPLAGQRLGICMVHQHVTLVPHLSVAENILLGHMPSHAAGWWVDWPTAYRRAQEVLDQIGFGAVPARRLVSRLTPAQKQMVEIAKAVALQPRVLIMDEPSAVFAQEELAALFALIERLRKQSVLILYISHRLDEVFAIADRVTVLKDGALVGTVRPSDTDKGSLIRMMVGRPLDELFVRRTPRLGPQRLALHSLSRSGAFKDVSFTLAQGEIVGMYGLVGSGRTEVARCIFGADRYSAGEVHLDGQPVRLTSPRMALQAGIAMLTEDRIGSGLVLDMSIRDNASLASLDEISRWGLLNRDLQNRQVRQKAEELDIRPRLLGRIVRTLSGGNQQKVVLAKWLLTRARVLILDEPTRGVDVAAKREIYEVIGRLADSGMSILLISSELPEILGTSDRILVMREGRLAGSFTKTQASEESLLACAAGVTH